MHFQVAIFFTSIGLCCALLFWPLALLLVLTGVETVGEEGVAIPWLPLIGALFLSLAANLLANFGVVVTYESFITLGLILAVPACAYIDVQLYGAHFEGMRLAGIILICCGFVVVLLPSNWPEIFNALIRLVSRRHVFLPND